MHVLFSGGVASHELANLGSVQIAKKSVRAPNSHLLTFSACTQALPTAATVEQGGGPSCSSETRPPLGSSMKMTSTESCKVSQAMAVV